VRGATRETANIYVANADGTDVRRLTSERVGIVSHHPSWSTDGRQIVFMSNRGAALKGASLWILNVNGGGTRRLTRSRYEDADPAWQPTAK
jgi:Tol biopolymer transport system component